MGEKPLLMEMQRRMLRIRRFEEQVIQMVERGEIIGAAHSYIGEEAVAVVAVASGDGLERAFRELGAAVVQGGQTMNPSAEEIAAAAESIR